MAATDCVSCHVVFVAACALTAFAARSGTGAGWPLAAPHQPTALGELCREHLTGDVVFGQMAMVYTTLLVTSLCLAAADGTRRTSKRKVRWADLERGSSTPELLASAPCCAPSIGRLARTRQNFFVDVTAALALTYAGLVGGDNNIQDPPAQVAAAGLMALAACAATYHLRAPRSLAALFLVVVGGTALTWMTCAVAWTAARRPGTLLRAHPSQD